MKTILSHKVTHMLIVAGAVAVAFYAYFGGTSRSEAIVQDTVGPLIVDISPNPAVGSETITARYEGIGELDISGWNITDDNGFNYSFPEDTLVPSGGSFTACADEGTAAGCDDEWQSGQSWNDTEGAAHLYDATGFEIDSENYSNLEAGGEVQLEDDIKVGVRENKDAVQVCHTDDEGASYMSKRGNINNIIGKNGHAEHPYDIIRPFFYYDKSSIRYYEGQNWLDNKELYENDCV